MLNKNNNNESFVSDLRQLSLEQLREKESFLIDEILRHYDELEDTSNAFIARKMERALERDLFNLDNCRNEINYKLSTVLINSCNGIFKELRKDEMPLLNMINL